jgi:prolyl-tRNA synthetase
VFAARRDTRAKASMPMDGLADAIKKLLDEIQDGLFARAVKFRDEHTSKTDSYEEFKQIMEGRPGFVIAPWCGMAKCEADIKAETQATIRNIPTGYGQAPGKPCIKCDMPASVSAWFAKAY